MALSTAAKAQLVKQFEQSKNDTGSPEVQIAILSADITALTEHLKTHVHDFHSRHGLTKKVSQRRKLLRYLKGKNIRRFSLLLKELDIRG